MRRGSALIVALVLIAVLSLIVFSFVDEARMQTGVNVYVRERNRVNRLVEAGQVLAEIVLVGFKDVKEPEIRNGEPDWKDIFEDEDRWCKEKYALKNQTRCTIGPILLDEEDKDSGTVTVDIELANGGDIHALNINNLYDGGDKDYLDRWQQVLESCGVFPELEVEVEEADGTTKTRNFMNHLLACWNDWRKGNAESSAGPIKDDPDIESQDGDGAGLGWSEGTGHYYYEYYDRLKGEARGKEEREQVMADAVCPKAGEAHEISDIKELGLIRGFRDFPSILTGGYLYDGTSKEKDFEKERGTEVNPKLQGIADIFGTSGSSKVVINDKTTLQQLLTVPGIFQVSGNSEDDMEDSKDVAQAILDALYIEPDDADGRAFATDASGRKWWPYKDASDLDARLNDNYSGSGKLGNEAAQYIEWNPSETSVFKVTIACQSLGTVLKVKAEGYVKDKKVRYTKWCEPATD